MPVCMREMSNHLQVVYDGLPVVSIDQLTLQACNVGCFECAGRSDTVRFPLQELKDILLDGHAYAYPISRFSVRFLHKAESTPHVLSKF